ncbi:MAG TPA: DUF4349 domain-containing protein [Caldilineae bacterium]|nr:DUF4349 domain-containing protein [Caldilineae bacterium]
MKRLIFVTLLISTLLLAACGAVSSRQYNMARMETPAAPSMETVVVEKMVESYGANASVDTEQLLQERKVIYNADMTLVVADTEAAAKEVEELITSMGGYVANMNAYRGGQDLMFYDITLRVPAEQFDVVRTALRDMAIRVDSENINTDDITDQYYDLDARLRTLQATKTELLALLKETRERGGEVEDIMSIYRELTNIQGQIESLQGQLKRFDKLVAFSTISITLRSDEMNKPISTSWRPLEILYSSFRTLVSALQGLASILIYLIVVVLPILLILALPVALLFVVVRWFVRRRKARGGTQD